MLRQALFAGLLIGCANPRPGEPQRPIHRVTLPVAQAPVAQTPTAPPIAAPVAKQAAVAEPPKVAPPSPYPDDIKSVTFTTSAIVYVSPSTAAERAGVVSPHTRAAAVDARLAGDGCARRWIAIAPRGWVCESVLAPSHEPPTAAAPASLHDDDEPQLGVYGAVYGSDVVAYATRADAAANENGKPLGRATSVRAAGATTIDGKRYWITSDGALIDASSIAQMAPSRFHGVALDDGSLAIAWVHRHDKPSAPAELRDADGAVSGEAGPRARVAVREVSADGTRVRITDSDWIARADLRMPALAAPPTGTAATDKWLDIDLDDQVLVAYEGTRPVYATLVSTGRSDHATPEEIAHVGSKLRVADMVSTKHDVYSVADVPWTMYYDNNFALHTSYWHDGFGDVRSHGCVNLAPRDARALYGWSSPDVPPGWVAVYNTAASPGSLVRIHSHRVPNPAPKSTL
nr:L,D-transpeptidase family protein [Kofleriaceae bacterium]